MVDALRNAWGVLRRRGLVVVVQPADDYTPRLAIVHDRGRTELGAISRTPDEGVVAAPTASTDSQTGLTAPSSRRDTRLRRRRSAHPRA